MTEALQGKSSTSFPFWDLNSGSARVVATLISGAWLGIGGQHMVSQVR